MQISFVLLAALWIIATTTSWAFRLPSFTGMGVKCIGKRELRDKTNGVNRDRSVIALQGARKGGFRTKGRRLRFADLVRLLSLYNEIAKENRDLVLKDIIMASARDFENVNQFPIEDLKLDRIPPLEWKVPHEYPYPEVMWGQKLGIKAERVQNLVSFAREDQVYILQNLDFPFTKDVDYSKLSFSNSSRQNLAGNGLDEEGKPKIAKRKRHGFPTLLRVLMLYNEMMTENRPRVIETIIGTPPEYFLDKIVRELDIHEAAMNSTRDGIHNKTINSEENAILVDPLKLHGRAPYYLRMVPPIHFTVPEEFPWPRDVWGVNLGQMVADLRRGRTHSRQKTVLDRLQFPWSPISRKFAVTLEALSIYRSLYGNKEVPSRFIVPIQRVTRQYKLRDPIKSEYAIDGQPNPEYDHQNTALDYLTFQGKADALERIPETDNTTLDSPWPRYLAEFNLGYNLATIIESIREDHMTANIKSTEGKEKLNKIKEKVRLLAIYGIKVELESPEKIAAAEAEKLEEPPLPRKNGRSSARDLAHARKIEKVIGGIGQNEPITLGGAAKLARNMDQEMKRKLMKELQQDQRVADAEDMIVDSYFGTLTEGDLGEHVPTAQVEQVVDKFRKMYGNQTSRTRFGMMIEGLMLFRKKYGHYRVPVQYIIGQSSAEYVETVAGDPLDYDLQWPENLLNFRLGKYLSQTMASIRKYEKEVENADGDGYCDDDEGQAKVGDMENSNQMPIYSDRLNSPSSHNGANTPSFANNVSPQEVQKLEKQRAILVQKRQILKEMGVPVFARRENNFELILKALKTHDELFGDLLVPRYFVVPSEHPWPEDTWGMPLGHKVRNIKYRGAYGTLENRKRLREMGFEFEYVKDAKLVPTTGQDWYEGAYELYADN